MLMKSKAAPIKQSKYAHLSNSSDIIQHLQACKEGKLCQECTHSLLNHSCFYSIGGLSLDDIRIGWTPKQQPNYFCGTYNQTMIECAESLREYPEKGVFVKRFTKDKKGGHWWEIFFPLDASGKHVVFRCANRFPYVDFSTFQFNPARLGKCGVECFKRLIWDYIIPDSSVYFGFMNEATVRSFDLAFDFEGHLPDLRFYGKNIQKHEYVEDNDVEGNPTLYIGSKHSPLRIVVYDKTKQLRKQKEAGNIPASVQIPLNLIRVEFRRRKRLDVPLMDLDSYDVGEMFSRLLVVNIKKLPALDDFKNKKQLLSAIKKDGLQAAIKLVSGKKRKQFIAALQPAVPECFQSISWADGWSSLIHSSGIISPPKKQNHLLMTAA